VKTKAWPRSAKGSELFELVALGLHPHNCRTGRAGEARRLGSV